MKKIILTMFLAIALLFNTNAKIVHAASDDAVYENLCFLSDAAYSAGYIYTSYCLNNALAGYPNGSNGDLVFGSGSDFSDVVKSTSEYNSIYNKAISLIKSGNSNFSFSGSTAFRSKTDLYLSINKASYVAYVTKVTTNFYNLEIVFKDTYNFEPQEWEAYHKFLGFAI